MKASLLLIFILFSSSIYCQEMLQLKSGRLNTSEGDITKFKTLTQTTDGFSFYNIKTQSEQSLATDKVLRIEKKSGNNALLFGIAMGASGFLGAFLGTEIAESNAQNQGLTIDKNKQTTTVVVLTGVSAIIGAIWGANTPKYSKVYQNPKYSKLNFNRFHLFYSYSNTSQIGFIYKF